MVCVHCAGLRASQGSLCSLILDSCLTHPVKLKRGHIFPLYIWNIVPCLPLECFPVCTVLCTLYYKVLWSASLYCNCSRLDFPASKLAFYSCQVICLKSNSSYTGPLNNTGLNREGPLTHGFFSVLNTIVLQGLWLTEPGMRNHECGKTADVMDQLCYTSTFDYRVSIPNLCVVQCQLHIIPVIKI